MNEKISKEKLLAEIKNREGLVPFRFRSDNQTLTWVDMENYHPYEGFFYKSVNIWSTLKNKLTPPFISLDSGPEVLSDERILTDNIYPAGFIFHSMRCGSTLLLKSFSRSRQNLTLGEYNAHNSAVLALTENGSKPLEITAENKKIFRNLILATTRKRVASHQNCIIKFTSYNIFFYDFIRRVFPDVPAIFLYRNPAEILSSLEKGRVAWMTAEDQKIRALRTRIPEKEFTSLDSGSYLNKIVLNLFSAALNVQDDKLKFINFKNLKAENFQSVLDIFNLEFDDEQINRMKSQFNYYSKSELKLVKFSEKDIQKKSVDEKTYREKVSPELRDAYVKLCQRDLLLEKSRHQESG